jgi:CrcB protein
VLAGSEQPTQPCGGGYTTFSTFGWDTFQLIQSGRPLAAFANAAASIAAGPAAAWLGWLLASRQH